VREHHFPISEVDAFFLDGMDYKGLDYWYDEISDFTAKVKSIG